MISIFASRVVLDHANEESRAEGLKEGRAEGLKEAKAMTAKNLKGLGVDMHIIAEATGLPVETIEKL